MHRLAPNPSSATCASATSLRLPCPIARLAVARVDGLTAGRIGRVTVRTRPEATCIRVVVPGRRRRRGRWRRRPPRRRIGQLRHRRDAGGDDENRTEDGRANEFHHCPSARSTTAWRGSSPPKTASRWLHRSKSWCVCIGGQERPDAAAFASSRESFTVPPQPPICRTAPVIARRVSETKPP